MPDAVEAFRQHVDQKAADELGRSERHRLVAGGAFDPVVLDLERHTVRIGLEQAAVLGFTHVWGKSRQGKTRVWQLTVKSRYARALSAVSEWCRHNRHLSLRDQHAHLSKMMRGHYAYYGISGNSRRIRWFAWQVVRVWRKWLSRRDRQGVFLWSRLNELLKQHPLPPARIVHRYEAAVSKAHP